MNTNKNWLSGFLGGIAVSVLLGGAGFYLNYGTVPFFGESVATGKNAQKAARIERMIEKNYLEDVDRDTLTDGMYAGMMASLEDPYSGYFSKETYRRFLESTEGEYKGIGLSMQQDAETNEISVYECFAGSPAEAAGVKVGDIIYKVDDQVAAEMTVTELANQIKDGDREEIHFTLIRDGKEMEVTIVPDTIEVPMVSSRMLEDSIGYIQIEEFMEKTTKQFETAYDELREQGMQGLIIDLRENPGGLLSVVCDILEQILPEGMIVYTEDKYGNREEHTCKGKTPIEIPLVVLVNEGSASASEIFAGAVKDHGVGTLVGTTTFGKGIVQKTYALGDGSAVKMTVSKYYTPNGMNIHGTGIEPDEEVHWPEEQEALGTPKRVNQLSLEEWLQKDNQMKKSWEIMHTLIADAANG